MTAVVVAVVFGLTAPAAATQVPGTHGPYRLVFYHSGLCVDVPAYSTADVSLDQWECVYQTNEYFWFDDVGEIGGRWYWRIRNVHSDKCLNVDRGSTANEARIIQYACGPHQNEYFRQDPVPDKPGWYWLVAGHSGKVLNVYRGLVTNGAPLIQYDKCLCYNEYVALVKV